MKIKTTITFKNLKTGKIVTSVQGEMEAAAIEKSPAKIADVFKRIKGAL